MSPGAALYESPPNDRRDRVGTVWAALIAILFAAVAAISFAVDQTVTLSSPGLPPPASSAAH